jgi:hypothetical protein
MDWMSPYVWQAHDGQLADDRCAGANPLAYEDPTGTIWCGSSEDGVTFHMDPRPVIVPGPESSISAGLRIRRWSDR